MKNNFCVYIHILEDGRPFYVGKGRPRRPHSTYARSKEWLEIYKNNKIDIIILEENLTNDQALILERYWIKRIGRENLVNKTNGGQGSDGFKHSEETRAILKENALNRNMKGSRNPNYGGGNWSEETRKSFSEKQKINQIGINNSFYGKKHTDEARKKMSNFQSGKKLTKEHIEKIIKNLKCTRKLTKEQVIEIRKKYIPYIYTISMLSKEYNVSTPTIKRVLNKTTYSEI